MKNIAIVSPLNNAYSETFIKAHKDKLKGNIVFYYGNVPPRKIEGYGFIKSNLLKEIYYLLISKVKKNNDIRFELRFKDSLRKNKINLVLVEYGTTAVAVLNTCKQLSIPLIVHFHGGDASVYDVLKKNKQDYKKVFKYARSIIVVSKVMKKKIISIGAPEGKVVLNTYGPNDLFYNIEPSFSNKTLIGIGRFVDKKAPYYTILAFQKVLKKHPDAELLLAGDGFLLDTCKNLVKYLDIGNNVKFLGVITPEQYKKELKSTRAFVQHSITASNGDMEGTPLAVLEASSAGIPVISTFHAGIPDVIIDKETGLLVEEHDVDGMANNMIKVLDSTELAMRLGKNGKRRIHKEFSMQKHINKIDELIGQFILT